MPTYRVRKDALPYLNVRQTPNGTILGKLMPGEIANVIGNEGEWTKLAVYVKSEYLEQINAPVPSYSRKMSLHIHTGNKAAGVIDAYRNTFNAGKPMPLALVINDVGMVAAIRVVSRSTFIVFRGGVVDGGDGLPLTQNNRAANMLAGRQRFLERYAVCPADCYQIANEHFVNDMPDWMTVAMGEFYEGAMIEAEARNTLVTVGDFSAGTPDKRHINLIAPALRRAEANGHPVNYHGYAPPKIYDMTAQSEWFSMRWTWFTEAYPRLRIVIGECGGYGDNGPDAMRLVLQYHPMLASHPAVIGAAIFTANAGADWEAKNCNFDTSLPAFVPWYLTT